VAFGIDWKNTTARTFVFLCAARAHKLGRDSCLSLIFEPFLRLTSFLDVVVVVFHSIIPEMFHLFRARCAMTSKRENWKLVGTFDSEAKMDEVGVFFQTNFSPFHKCQKAMLLTVIR
jgi:hypothetical protein